MKSVCTLHSFSIGLVILLLGVSGGQLPQTDKPDFFSQLPQARVLRVIDGDTVVCRIDAREVTVRLIGVDTPETVHPLKPVEAYGREASLFLTNLLKGEEVYIEREPAMGEDVYGRTLLYLYRAPDGLFVNLEIIRQGYGHAYTAFPFKYLELFRHYEQRARELGKGLWGAEAVTSEEGTSASNDDTIVYITRTGKRYHRDGCPYLRSRIPIKKSEAIKRGYTPCGKCKP